MEIAGYIASALVGISLGLIGGGGSILTVPVLVYLFRVAPGPATSYSLFIVGATSLAGAWNNYKKGMVSIPTALLFGMSSIATVFLTRRFIVPHIPEKIAQVHSFAVTKSLLIMVLFALLMMAASISMILDKSKESILAPAAGKKHFPRLIANGMGIGIVTGLLGAGGGFLLIPALVLLLKLPMKKAIGTSLLIIALNSLVGFAGDIGQYVVDWRLLLTITLLAIAGIFAGGALGRKLPGEKLKKGFGWFVLGMAVYILMKEFFPGL